MAKAGGVIIPSQEKRLSLLCVILTCDVFLVVSILEMFIGRTLRVVASEYICIYKYIYILGVRFFMGLRY